MVVYPWVLSNVISGSPELLQPYATEARFAAEYRNWHWQHGMSRPGEVELSDVEAYYPTKGDEISDAAVSDKGSNFGRFARTSLMDDYIRGLFQETLAGIPISAWQRFLKIFSEEQTEQGILRRLDRIAATEAPGVEQLSDERFEEIKSRIAEIVELARGDG